MSNPFQDSLAARETERERAIQEERIAADRARLEDATKRFSLNEQGEFAGGDRRAFQLSKLAAKRAATNQLKLETLFKPPQIPRPEQPARPRGRDSIGDGFTFATINVPIETIESQQPQRFQGQLPAYPSDDTKKYVLGLVKGDERLELTWLETEECE